MIIRTPKGLAGYLNLVTPDTRVIPEGLYKAHITLPVAEAAKLRELLKEETVNELGPKKAAKARIPGKENEDGSVTFSFKNTSKPNVYDSDARLLAPEAVKAFCIGAGSTIRVNGEAKAYADGSSVGVTLYLHEVQVIHLVRYEGRGFEPDAGGSFVVPDTHAWERGSYSAGGGE